MSASQRGQRFWLLVILNEWCSSGMNEQHGTAVCVLTQRLGGLMTDVTRYPLQIRAKARREQTLQDLTPAERHV